VTLFEEAMIDEVGGGDKVLPGVLVDATFLEELRRFGGGGVCAALDRCDDTRADFRGE
jgi:hypothetical protein